MLHTIAPIYDNHSKILILGSFPSVKSRETGFYYGHPQNRFWRLMATLLKHKLPETVEEKKAMLLENKIALWDVIASCDIDGSDDSSIRNVSPNNLDIIANTAQIKKIYTNGGTADKLYKKFCREQTGISAIRLPSTSPANAGFGFDKLLERWQEIIESIQTSKHN